jgi:hypothetical protein
MRQQKREIKFLKRQPANSGQATVEITLLLVITVSLVLLFSTQIYKPVGQYVNAYMGDYLACLLDYGVLPKLGSEDDICQEFKGSAAIASANRQGLNSNSNANARSSQVNRTPISPEQREIQQQRSGGGAQGIAQNTGRRSGPRGAADGGAGQEKISQSEAPPGMSSGNYRIVSNNISTQGQGRVVGSISGDSLSELDKNKIDRQNKKSSQVPLMEEDSQKRNAKKMIIKPPSPKTNLEPEMDDWGAGKLIRFLIIVGILLAILIFLGGQILQISKAWEK